MYIMDICAFECVYSVFLSLCACMCMCSEHLCMFNCVCVHVCMSVMGLWCFYLVPVCVTCVLVQVFAGCVMLPVVDGSN